MSDYRYPPVPAAKQPEEYKPYADNLDELVTSSFGQNGDIFTFRDQDGALIGPFPILIASKEAGKLMTDASRQFGALGSIPADAKEVAILVAGARFGAKYEQYAHANVAIKKAGLSEEQVETIRAGKKPQGLSEAASVVYDATQYLANVPGPLPKGLYDAAVNVLGKNVTLVMAHYVGMYSYMSVLMNLADAPVPED